MIGAGIFLPFVVIGVANEIGAGYAIEFEEVAVIGIDDFGW